MSHKLKSISLAGYKSIYDATVELRDLNVLIGANGAGKSNLISAFAMVREIVEGQLGSFVAGYGGAHSLLHFGRTVTEKIVLALRFGPAVEEYEALLAPSIGGAVFFSDEKYFNDGALFELGSGHRESKLKTCPEGARLVEESLKSWQVFHFHDVSENAPLRQPHPLADHQFLRADARNLAAFLWRLRWSEEEGLRTSYQRIRRSIRQVAPLFDDFVLEPDGIRPDLIQFAWRDQGSDEIFSALSEGTLRFCCLATLLLQPASSLPSLLLIDEPEIGLHPFAIHQLAALLKAAATRTQVIVSTQSVTLINQLEAKDLIVVDRKIENGRSCSAFRRISDEEISPWACDYALGEIWEKNLIGGRPR